MTKNQSAIEVAADNSLFHWFEDGITQILRGIGTFLLSAGFLFWRTHYEAVGFLIYFACLAGYFCLVWNQKRFILWLKEWVTYPRAGYTMPPPEVWPDSDDVDLPVLFSTERQRRSARAKRIPWLQLGIFLPTVLAAYLFVPYSRWFCLLMAIETALANWIWSRRRSSWLFRSGIIASGFFVAFFPFEDKSRWMLLVLCLGITMIIEGIYRLLIFLWRNPEVKEAAE